MMKFLFAFLVVSTLLVLVTTRCGKLPEPSPVDPLSQPQIGTPGIAEALYHWTCSAGIKLDNYEIAQPHVISITRTGTCTVEEQTKCGSAKSSVIVHAWLPDANGVLKEVK